MRPTFGVIAFALLLQGQSCDLNQMQGQSPEQIKLRTETELQTYFPHARVHVSETARGVIGLTCTANLGRPVIEQMVPLIDRSEGVQKLKETRKKYAGFEGLASLVNAKLITYRYFMLGFDQFLIRLDADSNQYALISADQVQGYENLYKKECGVQQRSNDKQSQEGEAYIWLGVFTVTAQYPDGTTRTFRATDTLGLYTEADFNLVRIEEIKHREQLMRGFMEGKERKVISIELQSVDKMNWSPANTP